MKLHPFIAIGFVLMLSFFATLFYFDRNRKINTQQIKKQKTDLSIEIGKLLFINVVLSNKDKNKKQIDSIYEIRKDSILDKIYK